TVQKKNAKNVKNVINWVILRWTEKGWNEKCDASAKVMVINSEVVRKMNVKNAMKPM
ncbi:22332_t:CDS:1, partial [Racocetra persica]